MVVFTDEEKREAEKVRMDQTLVAIPDEADYFRSKILAGLGLREEDLPPVPAYMDLASEHLLSEWRTYAQVLALRTRQLCQERGIPSDAVEIALKRTEFLRDALVSLREAHKLGT